MLDRRSELRESSPAFTNWMALLAMAYLVWSLVAHYARTSSVEHARVEPQIDRAGDAGQPVALPATPHRGMHFVE